MKDIAIIQKKVAAWLLLNNCSLVSQKPDLKDNRRTVYFFRDDDRLSKALKDYPLYKDNLNSIINRDKPLKESDDK